MVDQKQSKNYNLNERFHFKSYLNSYESIEDNDKNSQSNIVLPIKNNSDLIKKDFLNISPFKKNNPKYPVKLESENYFFQNLIIEKMIMKKK